MSITSRQTTEVNRSVVIENYKHQAIELDSSIIIDITIHESLNDNVMHGEVTILDVGGFEERIPIVGQERLEIRYATKASDAPTIIKKFVVYNMSPKITEDKKQAYILFFVSEEYIANLKYKVSRSYKSKFAGEIVPDIYESFIENNVMHPKPLFGVGDDNVDKSALPLHLVMGMFRPFECINLVAKRSVSARKGRIGSKFLFYEDKNGFHFKSLESLMAPKSGQNDLDTTIENKQIQISAIGDPELEEEPIMDKYVLIPANALSDFGVYSKTIQEQIITTFKFESTFNVIANIVGGMYNSRLLTYDPITMRVGALDNEGAKATQSNSDNHTRLSTVSSKSYVLDYLDRFNQFTNINDEGHPLINADHFAYGSPDACYKFVSTNFERDRRKQVKILSQQIGEEVNTNLQTERWLLPNLSRNRQTKNIVLTIRVAGNHNRTVGDLVHIDLPSLYFEGETHTYYTGTYLISELSHKIIGEQYYMDIKLIKDNLTLQLAEPEVIREPGALTGELTSSHLSAIPGGGGSVVSPEYNTSSKNGIQTSITS